MSQAIPSLHLGIEIIREPDIGIPTELDILTVHGITASPTWTASNAVNWLTNDEMLPKEIPNARVLQFEYPCKWLGNDTVQTRCTVIANQLLAFLAQKRHDSPLRPLILVAHCFGGIVIERAIIEARLASEDHSNILASLAGIIFIGTPHRGTDESTENWIALVGNIISVAGLGDASIYDILKRDSAQLKDQFDDFVRYIRPTSVPMFCFFEQLETAVTKVILPHLTLIVDETSAYIPGYRSLGLCSDHFRLNRYTGPGDPNYQLVIDQLKDMANKGRTFSEREREAFDQSLLFPNLKEATQVSEAYADTCSWILEDDRFCSWLKQEDGVFWLLGKAGSGKSTLMKHLSHYVPLRTLTDLAKGEQIGNHRHTVRAWFFFTSRGEEIERTHIGMLQALLYHLIDQTPELNPKFLSVIRKSCRRRDHAGSLTFTWDASSLKLAITKFFEAQEETRIIFFVDGVDECRVSDRDEIASTFLKWIQESRQLKRNLHILFASRPDDDLKLYGFPFIDLREENTRDISAFVNKKLGSWKNEERGTQHYQDFANRVIAKADGVFLWVYLVVPRLRHAINRGDTLKKLKKVLDDVPEQLEDLYKDILSGIDPDCLVETLRVIQVVLLASRPLNLEELRHVFAFGFETSYRKLSDWEESDDFLEPGEQIRQMIQSRTRGLVEVSSSWPDGSTNVERTIRGHKLATVRENNTLEDSSGVHQSQRKSPPSQIFARILHETVKAYFLVKDGFKDLDSLCKELVPAADVKRIPMQLSTSFAADGHHYIARLCLKYLQLEDLPFSRLVRLLEKVDRGNFPFAEYAIEYCLIHARLGEEADSTLSQEAILQTLLTRMPSAIELFVYWAAEYNIFSCIEPLKRAGADFTTSKLMYQSALTAAQKNGFSEMESLISDNISVQQMKVFPTTREESNLKPPSKGYPYQKVEVLIVTEHDIREGSNDLGIPEEVKRLKTILRSQFNYTVSEIRLRYNSTHNLQMQLNYGLANVLLNTDGENTLFIVYYSGHGGRGPPGDLQTIGTPSNGNPSEIRKFAVWNPTRSVIEHTDGDVLLIMDCCFAGDLDLSNDYGTRAIEYLASTSGDGSQRAEAGPGSFSNAFIWALEQIIQSPVPLKVSTAELLEKLLTAPNFGGDSYDDRAAVLSESESYPKRRREQVPRLFNWNVAAASPNPIYLSPLAHTR